MLRKLCLELIFGNLEDGCELPGLSGGMLDEERVGHHRRARHGDREDRTVTVEDAPALRWKVQLLRDFG